MNEHPENDPRYTGLNVNAGVSQPPVVNPYLKPRRRAALPDAADLVEGILKGDVTRLAKASDPRGEHSAGTSGHSARGN